MLSVTLLLAAATAGQPAVTMSGELDDRRKRALGLGEMMFDRSDSNQDDQLDRAEIRKSLRLASLVVRDEELDRGTMDERIDRVLDSYDRNEDGQMSRAEMRRMILARIAEADKKKAK